MLTIESRITSYGFSVFVASSLDGGLAVMVVVVSDDTDVREDSLSPLGGSCGADMIIVIWGLVLATYSCLEWVTFMHVYVYY